MGCFFKLREHPPLWARVAAGGICLALILLLWFAVTYGEPPETRRVSPVILPSPEEVIASFRSLWFEQALTRNTLLSLWRVLAGFGIAAAAGVPLGILCGTWPQVNAFFAPISVFFRNVPISALVPLTLVWFGMGEMQKVMFIFVACVMFVVFDATRSVASVDDRYVQTALTLGASKFQVLMKVLVPLALPDIFGSLRLLFGLAFGYIILAEIVGADGGLGHLIATAQSRPTGEAKQHIYLLLATITVVAYGIDRALLFVQGLLFPYREV
ncbi:MAG: ABC transporter permease subunit [Planctomycetota bacterium]